MIFLTMFLHLAPPAAVEDASRYTNGKSLGRILSESMHFIACFLSCDIIFMTNKHISTPILIMWTAEQEEEEEEETLVTII